MIPISTTTHKMTLWNLGMLVIFGILTKLKITGDQRKVIIFLGPKQLASPSVSKHKKEFCEGGILVNLE